MSILSDLRQLAKRFRQKKAAGLQAARACAYADRMSAERNLAEDDYRFHGQRPINKDEDDSLGYPSFLSDGDDDMGGDW